MNPSSVAAKFNRTYSMRVEGKSGRPYLIEEYVTCVFDIDRKIYQADLNSGHFMLYNLSPSVRADIQKDPFPTPEDPVPRGITFDAGYESEASESVCFDGDIRRCFSYKDGSNVVTEIFAADSVGAVQNAQAELTIGYPLTAVTAPQALRTLVSLMAPHGVTLGAIGSLANRMSSTRGTVWVGSVWNILRRIAGSNNGYAAIDCGKAYLMGSSDYLLLPGNVPEISSATGMLQTPRRQGYMVDVDVLFEPKLQLFQQVDIRSQVEPDVNGPAVVQGIGHRGVISKAKDGGAVTSLRCQQTVAGTAVAPE